MYKSRCGRIAMKDKDRQRPLWMIPSPSGSLIDMFWAFTGSSSRSGQVIQHFQRGSDYYFIAGEPR